MLTTRVSVLEERNENNFTNYANCAIDLGYFVPPPVASPLLLTVLILLSTRLVGRKTTVEIHGYLHFSCETTAKCSRRRAPYAGRSASTPIDSRISPAALYCVICSSCHVRWPLLFRATFAGLRFSVG